MFTGIVEEVGHVSLILPGKLTISVRRVLQDLSLGDSIAVNGVCLTVAAISGDSFSVDIMPETVRRTNLESFMRGSQVNLERPVTLSGRLGGHLVQGHVDGTARVSGINFEEKAKLVRFETPPELMRYIVEKGFVAVNGVSLTVVERDNHSFQVSVVGYTGEHTTLGDIRVSDPVNIEVDIIAKYVEQFVKPGSSELTMDFLRENGFWGSLESR